MPKDQAFGAYREALKNKLSALGIDLNYHKASGDLLFTYKEGQEVEVVDFTGAYGANLLGHHHPALVREVELFFKKKQPNLVQGSICAISESLAATIRELFGDYVPIFTNTGAETVEAAIKHAYLENHKTRCWAINGGFHGKSLATLPFSLLHNEVYERPFDHITFLDVDAPDTWEFALSEIEEVGFVLVEPIRGEGGVQVLPPNFVVWLNTVTDKYNIPVIVDEIQCGLGRTGTLLASEGIGLRADYICLSKALGGGICKIGALLVKEERFIPDFAMHNTSTFADDGLSATVAQRVLEIIDKEVLPTKCAAKGEKLIKALQALQEQYPDVIAEVRGKGLMIGLEFRKQADSASNLLRILSNTDFFGYILCGHLLNKWDIRLMPTLSSPNTLRIQPSAYIAAEHIERLIFALNRLCEAIQKADSGYLLGYLVGRKGLAISDYRKKHSFCHEGAADLPKVAFLGHFIKAKDIGLWDASFDNWEDKELELLIDKAAPLLDPVIFDQVQVRSGGAASVHLSFIGLFLDSRIIEKAYRERDFEWIVENIRKAQGIAEKEGCEVLGLGGYTSILTNNGKRLHSDKIKVTTGNTLTTGMGVVAIREALEQKAILQDNLSIAIIGAGGNIANTYAESIASEAKRMVLIARKKAHPAALTLSARLIRKFPHLKVELYDQLDAIRDCEVVVAASNASVPIIFPAHLSTRTKVICDIAVPMDTDRTVFEERPDVVVLQGGIIRLPLGNNFVIGGIPLEAGQVFACMGETLLMGLDRGGQFSGSVGQIEPDAVRQVLCLAEQYGFQLGAFKLEQSF